MSRLVILPEEFGRWFAINPAQVTKVSLDGDRVKVTLMTGEEFSAFPPTGTPATDLFRQVVGLLNHVHPYPGRMA